MLRRIYGSTYRLGWLVAVGGVLLDQWQLIAGGVLASVAARLLGGPDPQFRIITWSREPPQPAAPVLSTGPGDLPPAAGVREPRRPLPGDASATALIPRPSR